MTLVGMIVDLGQLSEFQIVYYSLVLTVANLTIAIFLLWIGQIAIRLRRKKTWEWSSNALLVVSLLVGIGVGIVLGLAAERDAFFVTLRSLPITTELNKRSSSRPTTFLLSQNTRGRLNKEGDARPTKVSDAWALVTMRDGGRQYEGWPEFYGLGKEASEIYLSPACERRVENDKEKVIKVTGPGVIVYESEIRSIALLNRACSPCYLLWYPQEVPPDQAAACKR